MVTYNHIPKQNLNGKRLNKMTARINLRTGKITGCKEGSFAWWHEKGHEVYDNSEKGIELGYRQELYIFASVGLGIFSFFISFLKYFALLVFLIALYLWFYEELWCNAYAKKKLKEVEDVIQLD